MVSTRFQVWSRCHWSASTHYLYSRCRASVVQILWEHFIFISYLLSISVAMGDNYPAPNCVHTPSKNTAYNKLLVFLFHRILLLVILTFWLSSKASCLAFKSIQLQFNLSTLLIINLKTYILATSQCVNILNRDHVPSNLMWKLLIINHNHFCVFFTSPQQGVCTQCTTLPRNRSNIHMKLGKSQIYILGNNKILKITMVD